MIRTAAAIILVSLVAAPADAQDAAPGPTEPAAPAPPSPAARAAAAAATEVADAEKLFRTGQYDECILACDTAIQNRQWSEGWWVLKIRSELATGKYEQAKQTYEQALDRHFRSVQLRLIGYDVHRANGDPQLADEALAEVRELVGRSPRTYADVASRPRRRGCGDGSR